MNKLGLLKSTRKIKVISTAGILLLIVGIVSYAHAVDFVTRCGAPAVSLCAGLNNASEVDTFIYGDDLGVIRAGVDTAVRASGTGSLRFTVPSNSPANSSGGFQRIIDEFGFGFQPGDTFYVQFRQRFSPEMLNASMGGNGWKQAVLSSMFGAVGESMDIGLVNKNMTGYPSLYFGDGTVTLDQNPADGIPVAYQANQWMAFYLQIQVGSWGSPNSVIRGWVGLENQPLKEVFNYSNVTLVDNPGDPGSGFNRIELTPHNTNKSSNVSHPQALTWYDELIVSNQPIADPFTPSTSPTPTPTPVSSPVYINTYSLPYGSVNTNYSAQIYAYGGSDSYTWSVSAGSLPPGLNLLSSVCLMAPCRVPAVISGVPTTAGIYTFTVRVTSGTATASRQYSITIRGDTTAPSISNASVTNITPFSATINWDTNEPADGQVEFCTSYIKCGDNTPVVPALTLQHSINLSGLNPNTTYYYWMRSRDAAGNLRTSWTRNFRTSSVPDTVPPTISITSPQDGSTVLGMMTLSATASDNVKVAGVMFYRDNNFAISYWEDVWSPYAVSFNTGLLSNGPHTFYAVARDSSNNRTTSQTITVNVSNPDTTSPYISNLTVTGITTTSAVINWTTNEPADSQVEFCTSYTRCGNNTVLNPSLTFQHSVVLAGLTPNTYYYAWIKSRDASGNLRESYRTFRTGKEVVPTPSPTPTLSPTPTPDTVPPFISVITVTSITTTSATINWTTSEPADHQVEYCTSYTRCGNNTLVSPSLATAHSVDLSGLTQNTYYYTWLKSRDASGNLRESYRTFRTAR